MTELSDKVRRVAIGLDPDSDQVDIWYTELEHFQPGENYFEVVVPVDMVVELEAALAAYRRAVDAIAVHVNFNPATGRLPCCDDYDGQGHEWNGRKIWDDCWTCGHDRDHHADDGAA